MKYSFSYDGGNLTVSYDNHSQNLGSQAFVRMPVMLWLVGLQFGIPDIFSSDLSSTYQPKGDNKEDSPNLAHLDGIITTALSISESLPTNRELFHTKTLEGCFSGYALQETGEFAILRLKDDNKLYLGTMLRTAEIKPSKIVVDASLLKRFMNSYLEFLPTKQKELSNVCKEFSYVHNKLKNYKQETQKVITT